MKIEEQNEINALPQKYKPLSMWAYFGYSILFGIPVVGFILLIVFSFSNDNINRRNFARSFFCIYIIGLIILAIATVLCLPFISEYSGQITSML